MALEPGAHTVLCVEMGRSKLKLKLRVPSFLGLSDLLARIAEVLN